MSSQRLGKKEQSIFPYSLLVLQVSKPKYFDIVAPARFLELLLVWKGKHQRPYFNALARLRGGCCVRVEKGGMRGICGLTGIRNN